MKIVVPIMPTSLEEAQALELSRFAGADIIEWRADFLDKDSILTVAPAIFEKFAGFEIIFTIRTTREGGKIELTMQSMWRLSMMCLLSIRQTILILSTLHTRRSLIRCLGIRIWCCLIIISTRPQKILWSSCLK